MFPRSATRTAAAIGGALVAAWVGAGPALAAPVPEIPADVQAAFAGPALDLAQAGDGGLLAALPGDIRAEGIHQVFGFSAEFVDGAAAAEPLTPTDGWLAALLRDDEVVGTLLVRKPDGGPAETTGFSDDAALGSILGQLSATDVLIEDAPSGSFFGSNGTIVWPLNRWARAALPEPAGMSDLQHVVVAQAAARAAGEARADGFPAPGVYLGALVAALVVGLAVAVGVVVRQRRGSVRARGLAGGGP